MMSGNEIFHEYRRCSQGGIMTFLERNNGMLPREYEYLLSWIRSVLHGTTAEELPGELSFEKIYETAMAHDVGNLTFYAVEQLNRLPEPELYKRWRVCRDLALVRDMNQEFARQELTAGFAEAGIPYLELQGTVLKGLYPRPEYRTMSDLDFILEPSHLEEGGGILQSLGYYLQRVDKVEIDGKRKPNIYVELHTEYFPKLSFLYGAMGEPDFSTHRTEEQRIEELYLYNMIHVAKHYYSSGCGLRRVLDVYMLEQSYGDRIDRTAVEAKLAKAGIPEFYRQICDLAQVWFGKEREHFSKGLSYPSKETEDMGVRILLTPLHGEREQYVSSRITDVGGEGTSAPKAKTKYILHRLFPGEIVMGKNYPFLKNYPILYPFCWIHRGLRLLFSKRLHKTFAELKMILRFKEDGRKRG